MTHLQFFDLPLTIRQQVYTELLVPPITSDAEGKLSQLRAPVDIFYVNRQIYTESSDIFYAKNLFVVISSNTESHFSESYWEERNKSLRNTRDKTPIYLEVRNPSVVAQCNRFAMTLELLGLRQLLPTHGTPAFIITAEALPVFASALIGKHKFKDGDSVARFHTHETFRYTAARFSDLIFGRFLSADRLPKLSALVVEGLIQEHHRRALIESCMCDAGRECTEFYMWLRCYRDRVWSRMHSESESDSAGIKNEIPYHQIHELPRLMLRMLDLFWNCHVYQQREFGQECRYRNQPCGVKFFATVADVYYVLAVGYLMVAKYRVGTADDCYLDLRRVTEDGIAYLNRDDRMIHSQTPKDVKSLDRAKAILSLKAAKACSRLGDGRAAEAYIRDAQLYSPHTQFKDEKLLKLSWNVRSDMSLQSHHFGPAVLWKVEDTERIGTS